MYIDIDSVVHGGVDPILSQAYTCSFDPKLTCSFDGTSELIESFGRRKKPKTRKRIRR